MIMRRDNGRTGRLLLGAATALAAIVAGFPQFAWAQGWQTELFGTSKKPPSASPHKMSGVVATGAPAAETARTPADDAPISLLPAIKSAPLAQNKASEERPPAELRRRIIAPIAIKPDIGKLLPGVEPAKAVVVRALPADSEPPVIVSSARKPATPASQDFTSSPPVQANELPEAAALRTLAPVAVEKTAAEAEITETPQHRAASAVQTANAEIPVPETPRFGKGKDDKASVLASRPPALPVPALPPVNDKNHTIAEKTPPAAQLLPDLVKPAVALRSEPARSDPPPPAVSSVAEADEPPAIITSTPRKPEADVAARDIPETATGQTWAKPENGPQNAPETAAVSTHSAAPPLPALTQMEEPPVIISSAVKKPAADASPAQKNAAKEKDRPKGKRGGETVKAANAAAAKGKPSRSKPDPASVATAGKPQAVEGGDAPVSVSSAPAKGGKGGKAGDRGHAQAPRPPVLPVTIIGPAHIEAAKPELLSHRADSVVTTSAASEQPPALVTLPETAERVQPQSAPADPAARDAAVADDSAEPEDPFVDVRLMQTRGQGDEMTTQVVPTNTPPDATGQISPANRDAAGQYCSNIVDPAIDARIAWQRQNLEAAEKQIAERARDLEAKTAEYRRWLDRRDAFSEKAKKTMVDIYTKMKPDAAALQLQAMDEETAAALIVKLDSRSASAVMNEMDPEKAARLSSIISGASKGPISKVRPPQPATGSRS